MITDVFDVRAILLTPCKEEDKDKEQENLYGLSTGIVLNDTITVLKNHKKGDVLISINSTTISSMDDFLNSLKSSSIKDSLHLSFSRVEQQTTTVSSSIAIADLKSVKRKNLTSIFIYLEEKFSPLKY